ncbi:MULTISPECIES: hypothetical protein [Telluria group]|uniref:DUF883 family protein n=1 Tax=Rugamonas aquatica TaxID=2743357 RepID=A0A6A7N5C6_9BURK|nr:MULTISPECIES: hypothetical protein [Telluria group]MQA40273.1 hypothetical protein [Rugamonas aquatica]OEZ58603.1 hypothetical protein DUGA6_40140 [Duganella sp. HH105]OFA04456.1 hypothetical protein DUGA2_20010 [Duganella sp. HH101]
MENSIDSKINSARDGVTQIGNNLRADAHAAIDKVADKVPPTTDRLANSAHNGVDKVADGVNKVADTVESTSDRLIARGKQVSASCKALTESGRSHVRASPAISVLLAAAAGYGISKLLSSRSAK